MSLKPNNLNINLDPNIEQNKASNPKNSVWVSASAGSGKTKVLIDRILRLLLNNAKPSEILCITFTKAAANVIKNRIIEALSRWSYLAEKDLVVELDALLSAPVTNTLILTARSLCNNILDSLSGIRVQTIHSFCQGILASVRIEADIMNQFQLIEENSQLNLNLKQNITNKTLQLLLTDSELNQDTLLYYFTEHHFHKLITNILQYEQELNNLHSHYSNSPQLKAAIYKVFNVERNISYIEYKQNHCSNSAFNYRGFQELLIILINNDITKHGSQKITSVIETWLALDAAKRSKSNYYKAWEALFVTGGKARSSPLPTKIIKLLPAHLQGLMEEEYNRLEAINNQLKNIASAEINFEFLKLAIKVINEYKQQKITLQVFDYNQLLNEVASLLKKPQIFSWIAYKFDQKISHILIDEAQDTSIQQWDIIKQIVTELFSNNNDPNNSLFVVGDIKQSIYGFQGASPKSLTNTKHYLEELITSNSYQWCSASLNVSFRSSPSIIKGVNSIIHNIFNVNEAIYQNEQLTHYSYKQDLSGLVEIWPLVVSNPESSNENYNYLLANAICSKITTLIKVDGFKPSDIMVLFKKRQNNKTITCLIKLLTNNGIPVSGLDKLELTNHIAMLDIIAIAKFAAQPLDDFNLACLLKSPIFNFNDDDLTNLICEHKSLHLWQILNNSINQKIITSVARLNKWLMLANNCSLFEFFIDIFYKDNVLNSLTSAFGAEIEDFISEFINFVLNFEKTTSSRTLEHFISLIDNINPSTKRDLDSADNMVKFMTIHSSKGLEEKIVFVVDDLSTKYSPKTIIKSNLHPNFIFIKPIKEYTSWVIDQEFELIKEHEQDELKRLLYVAITRSKERLYICAGAKTSPEKLSSSSGSIYQTIINNINADDFTNLEDEFFSPELGFCSNLALVITNNVKINPSLNTNEHQEPAKNFSVPNWALTSVPNEIKERISEQVIKPSQVNFHEKDNNQAYANQENTNYTTSPEFNALDYPKSLTNISNFNPEKLGTVIHQIMEFLPFINEADQANYITQTLNTNAKFLSQKEALNISSKLLNLINKAEYGFIFKTENSYSELAISGKLNNLKISARIDKIVITSNKIFIIDYKLASSSQKNIQLYSKQLDYYKALLESLYPTKQIKAFLLFLMSQDLVKV